MPNVLSQRSHVIPFFTDILDESDGCGQKIVITIVSGKFQGVTMIQQHRMVNKVCWIELTMRKSSKFCILSSHDR